MIGPESTGKSTLSEGLAKRLNTVWVPEYAREYLEDLGRPYEEADLLRMAEGQLQAEAEAMHLANNCLICDTDLYVIKVWSEAKYGHCDPAILKRIATYRCDMYLLTDIDIPWQDDPLREHPLPEERAYFYRQYHDIVMNSGVPWANIGGNIAEREERALDAIYTVFGNKQLI